MLCHLGPYASRGSNDMMSPPISPSPIRGVRAEDRPETSRPDSRKYTEIGNK